MLLAVDVGNTQTHLGAFDGERLAEHWRFQTRSGATGDELAERIGGLLALCGMALDDLDAVCVSSVVPPLGTQYRAADRALPGRRVPDDRARREDRDADSHRQPARGRRRPPGQLDRRLRAVRQSACVVVDFGTGINIDAVSADGEYLGGAIGPGLEISLTALIDRAARITRIDLEAPEMAIGRSSRAAIQSGFVFGFAGLIDGVVGRIEEELSEPELLATGGLAHVVVPFTETIDEVDDMLTLKGLRLIHERNTSNSPR